MDNFAQQTYQLALESSKEYFAGDELPAKVFVDKYAVKDSDGHLLELNPDYMHKRLAREFARIDRDKYGLDFDERYQIYYDAMKHFARIVPQGSPMAAIGNLFQRMSASNCVVIESPQDSIGGIFEAGLNMAQLYKRRCGVGLDISTLRPEGTAVNNAAKTTSGAWSFAEFFSFITRMIGQNSRRGALMVTLSVHHPDVLKFTTMKQDLTKVTGANVSLRLSNEFLEAVENDTEYEVRWPVEGTPKVRGTLRAREVWNTIIESATKTAEPGLIMWDNMISNLPAHVYEMFKTISTNPCSEIALSAFDSCRLISINLTGYVRNPFKKEAYFDYRAFVADIAIAQQMADNLVDLELELIERIKDVCDSGERVLWNKLQAAGENGRRTGLGTHGLADALAQLGLRYDSDAGLEHVESIYRTLRDAAYWASTELARVRGPFPVFDYNKELTQCDFIRRLPEEILQNMERHGRRNIAILTQAPTGSVSILSKVGDFNRYNVSSGVEPVFRNFYTRRKKINPGDKNARVDFTDIVGDSWQEFKVYHANVQNYLEVAGEGAELPDFFVTSDQIDWEKRVRIQGIEQQFIDHSISSTINLPRNTPSEVVGNLYLDAWKKGLKGVTVYVDGSRDGVLVTEKDKKGQTADGRPTKILSTHAPARPKELPCEIHKATVRGTKWTVVVGLLDGDPYELFMGHADLLVVPNKVVYGVMAKTGKGRYNLHFDNGKETEIIEDVIKTCNDDDSAWATRMISTSLRHGVPIDVLTEQLSKDGSIVDINMVLSRILRKYAKNGSVKCPNPKCTGSGTNLIFRSTCFDCLDCGWSGCS